MSLILDALNRSRQDTEQVPGLASQHPVGSELEDAGAGISWLQWLLVAALALAVIMIAWLLFDRMPQPTQEQVTAQATAVVAVPPPAQTAVQSPRQEVQAKPAAAQDTIEPSSAATVAAAPAIAVPGQKSVAGESPISAGEAADPDPAAADPSVAALYQQRESQLPVAAESSPSRPALQTSARPATEEEEIDIELLVATAEAELADAQLQDNGVPFLATLSQQTKDAIPTLMYQRHDYSGNTASSSVYINGKKLGKGASVAGVRVDEILPDSVVLEYQGTRFRLRALNSWVNL